jgi:hypothetical protein
MTINGQEIEGINIIEQKDEDTKIKYYFILNISQESFLKQIVPKILDWSEVGKEYRITLKEGRKILSASWYILVSKSKIRAQEETSQIKPSPTTSTDVIDISDQVSSIKRFFEPKMDEYGYYGKGIFAIDSKDPKLQKERKMNKGERR